MGRFGGGALRGIARAYDGVIVALAALAGVLAAGLFLLIVVDVGMRMTGFQPPQLTTAAVEYALLYITMGAAPYLVRIRGHVFVTTFVDFLPAAARRVVRAAICVLCIAVCGTVALYAWRILVPAWQRGDLDIRSIDMPLWALYAPLVIGFVGMAIEFTRFLFGPEHIHGARDTGGL